ncbi:LAFA_0F14290g1_1 [Lachancea sp. 'fantastica']|nr:LAFA_0F14290g1_1 [Lachancea sp. 'fantastica']
MRMEAGALESNPERRSDEVHQVSNNEARSSRYIPPWTTPYIIGIGGTSGSGKTSVAAKITSSINTPWTVLISLDNFYKPLSPEQHELAVQNEFDFDKPDAIDLDLAYECIKSLKEGKKTSIPVYSFNNHNRVPGKTISIYGSSVVVVEGIYALYNSRLLELMDLKIYVDVDLDVCLARRLSRDIVARGRDLNGCIQQWEQFVKPNAQRYVRPTMKNADAIIPSMGSNVVATQTVINHIKSRLQLKSRRHLEELSDLGHVQELKPLSKMSNVCQLEPTSQVVALKTILLDKYTSRDDFVFYFDRIATILVSRALDDISTSFMKRLVTPTGQEVCLPSVDFDKVTSISIVRSGDCFMRSLKKTVPSMSVGKVLIQSDSHTGEPQLHCEFLPPHIENYEQVLLVEAQIISGAAVIMAIQVLLDHGVSLKRMKVLVYLATEIGIRRITNAFDDAVQIYAGEVIPTDALGVDHCKWARKRFIDSRYFGCD